MYYIDYMIRVFENIDICSRNSFKVHQQAAKIIEFDCNSDLTEIFTQHITDKWMVMGGANNILFTCDVEYPIIVPRNEKIEILCENEQGVDIRVGAGLEWDELVAWSVERGLWGLENLSLIPGKVGAAPVQNIGAYGAEAKDCITSVEMFYPEQGGFVTLAAEHCHCLGVVEVCLGESQASSENSGRVLWQIVCGAYIDLSECHVHEGTVAVARGCLYYVVPQAEVVVYVCIKQSL